MKIRNVTWLIPALVVLIQSGLRADEGLWLPNQFPASAVEKKYGFRASAEFVKHLQLAAVRFNNGGTGSFVSPDGLLFTNHHVGADCVQKLSSPGHDYIQDGFSAVSRADERKCPDLEVNVLLNTTEITPQVSSGVADKTPDAEAARLRRANIAKIEKQCATRTGNRCDVVTLFAGARYDLYEYKKYTDIRLVFAPEFAMAFFGGDPENFTYPRHDLDITFFRAYEQDRPARPLDYFRFSPEGARDGELIFTSGNPGTTGRLMSVAQLEFLRDTDYPLRLRRLKALADDLLAWSAQGEEQHRQAEEVIFGVQNSYKAYNGFLRGLKDPVLMGLKRAEERKFRAAVAADPRLKAEAGKSWDEIAAATAAFTNSYPEYYLVEATPAAGSSLFAIARRVARYAVETKKPNGERLREYTDAGLSSLEQAMYSPAPIHPELEVEVLAQYFTCLSREFGPKNALVAAILHGQSPHAAAQEYVSHSKLADVAERKRLAASPDAVAKSADGMIRLALLIDKPARRIRKQYEDQVESVLTRASARLARARFAVSGGNDYPDATFTLRISYGQVKGYGNDAGQPVKWNTDFAGLFAKNTGRDPFALPTRWLKVKSAINLKTPLNFVATADIHGGNSGSATLNSKGAIVGILFDFNLEALPNRFVYTDAQARSVHVASQGIVEALRNVYGSRDLLKELGF
ncbi:MAG: S46 family peptidase [Bryobacteraceae bacterium]